MNLKTVLDGSKFVYLEWRTGPFLHNDTSSIQAAVIKADFMNAIQIFENFAKKSCNGKETFKFLHPSSCFAIIPFVKIFYCKTIWVSVDMEEEVNFTLNWNGSIDNFVRLFHPFQI